MMESKFEKIKQNPEIFSEYYFILTSIYRKSNLFAYQNPAIQPDEELAKRGYSMYDGQFVPRLERCDLNLKKKL